MGKIEGDQMVKFITGVMYLYIVVLWILGGLMHFWTIYIAYSISGAFWGFVSLFFPVVAQIVWGFNAWISYGWDSPYIQWLVVLMVLWVFYYIILFFINIFDKPRYYNEKL
jgi:hypothetical protein